MSATIAQESARLSSIPAKPVPASRRTWRAHDEPVHEQVAFGEARGRWVLVAAVLGSGVALLDSTVVNNALPTLGRDLGADFAALQWTVNDYTLTVAALILLGGSLGDRYGRRQVFVVARRGQPAVRIGAGRPQADRRPDAAGGRRHARTWHALLSLTDQCRWTNIYRERRRSAGVRW